MAPSTTSRLASALNSSLARSISHLTSLERSAAAWSTKFFFFQAEDGIRGRNVTGVQTCALPICAAANEWKTDARKLHTENGFVVSGGKRLSYGDLAVAAQSEKPPKSVKLKNRKDWKIIGKPTRRLDSPEKITGKAQFAMDVKFPGLRTAVIARSPVFGGKVKSFDASAAKAVKGVEQVVQVPSGVAVVAANFWSAKVARDALKIEWDLGPGASVDSRQLLASYREQARTKGTVVVEKGDAETALATDGKHVVAEYDVPYLAHAPMEPLNATVKLDGDQCEIWTGTQLQTMDKMM